MKINSSKSDNQVQEKKQAKTHPKPELVSNLTLETVRTLEAKKDFASILKSTSEQTESFAENKRLEKYNSKTEVEDKNNDSKTNSTEKKEVGEEKQGKSNSDSKNESEQEKSFGNIPVLIRQNTDEVILPNGRAILHITDLERIISKIRSQTVANGKQITIELKRSVFDGLKLKITFGKDKSVTAEFLAANENVKSQLNARSDELINLLKNRGVKLTKIQMSLDSQSDENKEHNNQEMEQIDNAQTTSKSEVKPTSNYNLNIDTNTSYQA